jgi:RTX calcium-binding nonapeptide repeat (4 copies)
MLGVLAVAAAAAPAASAQAGITTAVRSVHGPAASAAAGVNLLTVNDQRGIDNRISAYIGSTGRLVLTAPEGLGDPDGSAANCSLDNAKPGEASATEVSCAAGYIGAIVGDLAGGSDTFDADPGLTVMVGALVNGVPRPLSWGPGRDRLIGGALPDLLLGRGGPDSLIGAGGNDVLAGAGGRDKLIGGSGKDACRGGGGADSGKNCEQVRSIP